MEFDIGFVHDSFCAHAPNVKAMKRLLLKTYKEYFSRDLLDELSKEVAITQDTEVQSRPQLGTYDVSQIHRCPYVFH
jgi:DNA-directed RNA polymerase